MFGFGKHTDERICFVVIDMGSGSAGASIMVSEVGQKKPKHVWSYREYALIKDVLDAEVSLKEVTTCLINLFLKLGNEGLRTLHAVDPKLKVTEMQIPFLVHVGIIPRDVGIEKQLSVDSNRDWLRYDRGQIGPKVPVRYRQRLYHQVVCS